MSVCHLGNGNKRKKKKKKKYRVVNLIARTTARYCPFGITGVRYPSSRCFNLNVGLCDKINNLVHCAVYARPDVL